MYRQRKAKEETTMKKTATEKRIYAKALTALDSVVKNDKI